MLLCVVVVSKKLLTISLQLSGDVFGRGFTAGPASNGLLSYYPEYTSFGEFLAGRTIKKGLITNCLLSFAYKAHCYSVNS